MPGSEAGNPNHMDIVFNGHFSGFFGGLKEGTDIDIETDIGVGGGDHFGSTVVTVLTHFNNHNPGATPFLGSKVINPFF